MFPRWGMGDAPSRVLAPGGQARLLARARVPFPQAPGVRRVYFSAPRTKRPMPYVPRTRAYSGRSGGRNPAFLSPQRF